MNRESYWSRSITLLGGAAKFDVYTPDDIEVTGKNILVRHRKADVKARLEADGENWQVCLGPVTPKQPFEGKHFATVRDLNRIRRAIETVWSELWTPEIAEEVFPGWFIDRWAELGAKNRTSFGAECEAYIRERQKSFDLLEEWPDKNSRPKGRKHA